MNRDRFTTPAVIGGGFQNDEFVANTLEAWIELHGNAGCGAFHVGAPKGNDEYGGVASLKGRLRRKKTIR